MGCDCQKPCGRNICCSICENKSDCEYVCKTCVPDADNTHNPNANSDVEKDSAEE